MVLRRVDVLRVTAECSVEGLRRVEVYVELRCGNMCTGGRPELRWCCFMGNVHTVTSPRVSLLACLSAVKVHLQPPGAIRRLSNHMSCAFSPFELSLLPRDCASIQAERFV